MKGEWHDGGYEIGPAETEKAERKAREAESRTQAWIDANPSVSCEIVCDCLLGEIWSESDFYGVYGKVPGSVAEAEELASAEFCVACRRYPYVQNFMLWPPGVDVAETDEAPMIEYDAGDD